MSVLGILGGVLSYQRIWRVKEEIEEGVHKYIMNLGDSIDNVSLDSIDYDCVTEGNKLQSDFSDGTIKNGI